MNQSPGASFLICTSGPHCCALPLQHVVETMRPLPAEALAGMPTFLLGISLIRGMPVPVIDLACLLGKDSNSSQIARYITLRSGVHIVATAVDTVVGVRHLPVQNLTMLPPLLKETNRQIIAGITVLDEDLLLILQSAYWLPEHVWDALDTPIGTT
ncbi:chemotaxis protein CheW [Chitinivorax sp. B]|uniref:chemotaxis protein CheW n=1 Tax=Chitinivorax sp. B TaxID=2502235 RepID=UPI001484DFDA|nr:chemotaxis protein CheW [Chitinivorax sp. B]